MISGYSEEEFGNAVHQHVRPSQPIDTIELLKGRQAELDDIKRALFAKGRNIFIYGDRGIGKSSLAQTAAFLYQTSDAAIVQIGCTRSSTFLGIMGAIGKRIADTLTVEVQVKAGVNLKLFSFEYQRKQTQKVVAPQITSMDDALDLIFDISIIHSDRPIIVIDEFDAIADQEERFLFAEFLKKMGDSKVSVPIIFSGIATSLDDLLGGHQSSIRQLKPIELKPISWDSRWDILVEALTAFGIEFEEEIKYRVAGISDGFPYYVHLITEHLLWAIYDDPLSERRATFDHYFLALEKAVRGVEEQIRKPYDTATLRHSQDFHHVIWAAADTTDLYRNIESMYASYERVIRDLNQKAGAPQLQPMTRKLFSQRLSTLTKPTHGSVLRKMNENRTGWYQFSENMLRGFVRLLAETNGIQLWMQEAEAPKTLINPRPQHVTKPGRYSPSVPEGVRLKDD